MTSATSEPILSIDGLEVRYRGACGNRLAVAGVSLTIERGECVGIVGESGCGKTTVALAVMRHLGRFGAASRGSIRFKGIDIAGLSPAELRRLRGRRIAMVSQDPAAALNPTRRIGRQLEEVLELHFGMARREARERTLAMLHAVHLPDPETILRRYPHQLSGGQKQRVMIAMAFLCEPELLVLDEPTTALDPTVERTIIDLLDRIRRERETTTLFISHDLGLVRRVCDRVVVMYAGEVVEEASTETFFRGPRHPYSRALLDCLPDPLGDRRTTRLLSIPGQAGRPTDQSRSCSFLPRCGLAREATCAGPIPLSTIAAEPAHRVRCVRWQSVHPISKPVKTSDDPPDRPRDRLLEVELLSKEYRLADGRSVIANRAISFSLDRGETLAVVGESGSGKSTLARILVGLEVASSGHVLLNGASIGGTPAQRRPPHLVRAVQIIFQNPDGTLNPAWSIGSILMRAIRRLGDRSSRAQRSNRMHRLLKMVRLPPETADMKPGQLSGGQRQRVAIARAFAGNPDLVIADEPTSALDASVKTAIVELLSDVQRSEQTALLFISHDLGIVRHMADRVLVIYRGEVVETGTTDAVFSPPYHPYTESLLGSVAVAKMDVEQRSVPPIGEPPSHVEAFSGCGFAGRCHRKLPGDICDRIDPPLAEAGAGHQLRCHIPLDVLSAMEPVFSRRPHAAERE